MKKLLTLLYLSIVLFSCNKDDDNPDPTDDPTDSGTITAVDLGDSEIPYIVITTSSSIQNEPKVPATMEIFESGVLTKTSNIGIEFRGSTSFRISDKKSYGIETWDASGNDVDDSFFGFPEEEDWILTGHVVNFQNNFIIDQTLMYHYFGYNLFREMGRYASRTQFVELQIDDEYLGVYVFMEKLKRDNDRIDISRLEPGDIDETSITGGYILKIDKTTGGDSNIGQPLEYFLSNWADDALYTETNSFRSEFDINGNPLTFPPYDEPYHANQYLETYFLYEYPKEDIITAEQKNYIQSYINDFETALLTDDFNSEVRTYTDYIDVESFVDFLLINEICRNVDGYRLSTYLHKDRGEKLKMGPIWDLNIGFDSGDRIPWDGWVFEYNTYVDRDAWMVHFWWPRLMEDPQFRSVVKSRWNALRGNVMSNASLLASVDENVNYLDSNGAIERNYNKWNIGIDYSSSIANLKEYLQFRADWMDSEIQNF